MTDNEYRQMRKNQERRQEEAAVCHHQTNELNKVRKVNQQSQNPNRVLLCACGTGIKCDGICRELHLYRPRLANPAAKKADKKAEPVRTQWAEKCPESYEQPVKS